jgi:hypothetical protein
LQLDCPSHVVVQPEPQLPLQVVFESQCEVQFVTQSTLQVFMCWQSSVTLDGKLAPPSAPPSALKVSPVPPMVQVPPLAQVQVEPLHAQEPVQTVLVALSSEHATIINETRRMRMHDLRACRVLDTCDEVG